jgi:hypothetical protein
MKPALPTAFALALLCAMLGCASAPIHFIKLDAQDPVVARVGSGQSIVLGEIKDGRKDFYGIPPEPGRFTHWRKDLQEHCGDASVGGFFCTEGGTPEDQVRAGLGVLLGKAGFKVIKEKDRAAEGALVLDGEVHDFGFITLAAPNNLIPGRSIATVAVTLKFSRDGRALAGRDIRGQASGRPFMHGAGDGADHAASYLGQALGRALAKASRFIESAEFQEKALNLPHSKVQAFHDGGGYGADSDQDEAAADSDKP